jgi:hypothetical protein
MDVSQRGDDFTAPDFQFVPLPELSGGGTKYDNSLEGYFKDLSKAKKDYLQELFYKQMKAMGGQRQLYEAVMNDPNRPSPHPSWREVRAWHAAQRVNALSRPANKQSKSLANPVVRSKLAPCARLGFDSVVMQAPSAKKDATKMGDQGFKGFLNIVRDELVVAQLLVSAKRVDEHLHVHRRWSGHARGRTAEPTGRAEKGGGVSSNRVRWQGAARLHGGCGGGWRLL